MDICITTIEVGRGSKVKSRKNTMTKHKPFKYLKYVISLSKDYGSKVTVTEDCVIVESIVNCWKIIRKFCPLNYDGNLIEDLK